MFETINLLQYFAIRPKTYDQVEVPKGLFGGALAYLKGNKPSDICFEVVFCFFTNYMFTCK